MRTIVTLTPAPTTMEMTTDELLMTEEDLEEVLEGDAPQEQVPQ
jgi:hypothetical protein